MSTDLGYRISLNYTGRDTTARAPMPMVRNAAPVVPLAPELKSPAARFIPEARAAIIRAVKVFILIV